MGLTRIVALGLFLFANAVFGESPPVALASPATGTNENIFPSGG